MSKEFGLGLLLGISMMSMALLADDLIAKQKTPSEVELLRKMVIQQENLILLQDQMLKDYADQIKAKCPN